ncbi:MAG: diguanylate cyclase, partial [Pseudomonadota bacterium]
MRFTPLTELPPGSAITVVDREGVILTRAPDPEGRWTGVNLTSDVPIAKAFIDSRQAEAISEGRGIDGIQRIYALARIGSDERGDGHILVGIPSQEIHAALNAAFLPRAAFLAATFLGILVLAWFGSEMLVMRRMRLLSTATRQMASGDFSVRAAIKGRDEIATLASEFNQLGDALHRNYHQICRLNRIHEVLSGINGAILRIRVQDELLKEACRIAVERGKLRFAWIGMTDPGTGRIVEMASHGEGKDFVARHCLGPHAQEKEDLCPCVAAMPQAHPVICNDLGALDQRDASWRSLARSHGFGALAGFPLKRDGKVIGVLGLYASEDHFFEAPEVDLFQELAADISLGLEYIDKDQRIDHLLYHDALTGLPNRTLCEDRLQQAILRARHHDRHVSVVVLNITDFHRLVGVHGHHVADDVLNMLATYLSAHAREGDTVSRLGGDEFAIAYVDIASTQDAIHLAQSLVSGLPSTFRNTTREIHLSIRGGAAIYPDDAEDAASLLVNATLASNSGQAGRSHAVNFYSSAIQRTASEREKVEQALRHAIKGDLGLALYYQPVVDIHTHRIVSLEALARWNSAEFGPVSPARFIPVAEETGLIVELGDWVLNTACRQIQVWRDAGLMETRVAINISFQQLRQEDFVERLAKAAGAINRNGSNL